MSLMRCPHCGTTLEITESESLNRSRPVAPWFFGFEYRSRTEILGLPLIHLAFGYNPRTGLPRLAKGVVAIGNVALGFIAVGGIAAGGFVISGIGMGFFALAGIAIGGVAVGGIAIGAAFALGGLAFSLQHAIGGLPVMLQTVVSGAIIPRDGGTDCPHAYRAGSITGFHRAL